IKLSYKIQNVHRSVGAQLSGEIAYRYGDEGLPEGTIQIKLDGSSGQSFGAFLVQGVKLTLQGEANDYVGKSMSGGEIVLLPPKGVSFDPSLNSICGNTCLYGATGGKLFAYGRAGERFAVRNSGATAVIEGVGDHGCEYMTGGTVVVLGQTGRNFAAGMSGGVAYIWDPQGCFESHCNLSMVAVERLRSTAEQIATLDPALWHRGECDEIMLKQFIEKHVRYTGSEVARQMLTHWDKSREAFVKVFPHEYRRALGELHSRSILTKTAGVKAMV
ncbi:MAG: glutamate synthase subunit alpha, partial [Betaproteobacteria bacterium]|nr:glutamate synthase subunit alpha [Betaproteobacteria bacterium]